MNLSRIPQILTQTVKLKLTLQSPSFPLNKFIKSESLMLLQACYRSWPCSASEHTEGTSSTLLHALHHISTYAWDMPPMCFFSLVVCTCACVCHLCIQAAGFQRVKLWLWAAVAGWPAEAVRRVGERPGCCNLRLPEPTAGPVCGNAHCWRAQLWYGRENQISYVCDTNWKSCSGRCDLSQPSNILVVLGVSDRFLFKHQFLKLGVRLCSCI